MRTSASYGLIHSILSRHSTTFRNLLVRNTTISTKCSFFTQQNSQEDTQAVQTTFKLMNGTIQDFKETINDASASLMNSALFIHAEGPTNYIVENVTANNTILQSKTNS